MGALVRVRRAPRLVGACVLSASQFRGSGDVGDDETVQVVDHRPGQDLPERSDIALVRLLHGAQVGGPLFFEDHDRRVAEPDQHQVQGQSSSTTVAVEERVDPFEVVVGLGQQFGQVAAGFQSVGDRADGGDPLVEGGGYQRPRRWGHPFCEGVDVVAPKVAGRFGVGGVRVGGDLPHEGQGQVVDVADLLNGDQGIGGPVAGAHRLPVHPGGGVAVALDLHVLPQGFRADGLALIEQGLDLTQDQGVAFQGGGVVRLQMPNVGPHARGFLRRGQPTEPGAEFGQLAVESRVDRRAGRAASCHHASSTLFTRTGS